MKFFLSGKKILFLGVGFYEYDNLIKLTIEQFGGKCLYFTDQPKVLRNSIIYRFSNIFLKITQKIRELHALKILKHAKSFKPNYIFLIKGEFFPEWFFAKLKHLNSNTEFIMYQWDSIKNVTNFEQSRKYFNNIFTFDRQDSMNYDGLKFRPLFFCQHLLENLDYANLEYDLAFIGQLHQSRLEILTNFYEFVTKNEITYLLYLKTGLLQLIKLYLIHSPLTKFCHLRKLPYLRVKRILHKANVILDIHSPTQSGLTMRTLEAIGTQKKLITTNSDIKNYDLYNNNNILILDDQIQSINKSFFKNPYLPLDINIFAKYSIERWIFDIFNL